MQQSSTFNIAVTCASAKSIALQNTVLDSEKVRTKLQRNFRAPALHLDEAKKEFDLPCDISSKLVEAIAHTQICSLRSSIPGSGRSSTLAILTKN